MVERTEAQQRLVDAMSNVSEGVWCAGWLIGLHEILWRWVAGIEEPPDYVRADVDNVRKLSAEVGGWFMWDDEAGSDDDYFSVRFIPMAEWLTMFEGLSHTAEKERE